MNRRQFLSHSLTAGGILAASQVPLFNIIARNKMKDKLGIALLGLGNYATNQLAPALQETQHCYLAGIITGKYDEAAPWVDKYQIPDKNIYDYKDFDAIADNKDIDIIYVVLPNGLHAEYTQKAAEYGKHVICEKPMANNAEDCEKMIRACDKAGKKLSIGYRLHFDPYNLRMMELGQNQVYGPVEEINAGFGFTLRNKDAWRLDKQLAGGGPLMDVGIYALQGTIYTLGELPTQVKAVETTKDKAFYDDIEGSIEWELTFPSGVKNKIKATYEGHYNYLSARAGKGEFGLSPAYSYGGLKGATPEGPMEFGKVNQQARQMDDVAKCIMEDKQSIVRGEMGWRDMFIIDRIYESAATGKAVSLKGLPQIIHKV